MTTSIATAHNTARLGGTLTYISTGAAPAQLRLYSGTRPASADTTIAPENAPLAAIEFTQPPGSIIDGVLVLTPAADGLILASGTVTWARLVNGSGEAVLDCDAGQGVGAWEAQLAQTELFAGGDAKLLGMTLG